MLPGRPRGVIFSLGLLAAALTAAVGGARPPALAPAASQQPKPDYLTPSEADKIRDADTPSQRIKLFMDFADDRLKKLKFTLEHPHEFERNRSEELNGLINTYSACIDDAADLVDLAREKQQDIRIGLKIMKAKTQEFLSYLEELAKTGPELDNYQENLNDAIESTRDALDAATKAEKQISAPVRRPH